MRCGCIFLFWTRLISVSIVWQCCHVSWTLPEHPRRNVEFWMEPSGYGLSKPIWQWRRHASTGSSSVTSSDSGAVSPDAVGPVKRTELHFEPTVGVSSSIPHPTSPATASNAPTSFQRPFITSSTTTSYSSSWTTYFTYFSSSTTKSTSFHYQFWSRGDA